MIGIKRDGEKRQNIWSQVHSKWLMETPEETVRQECLLVLVNEYGLEKSGSVPGFSVVNSEKKPELLSERIVQIPVNYL